MNLTLEAWLKPRPTCADEVLWRCLLQAFVDRGWTVELISPPVGATALKSSPCFQATRAGRTWTVLAWFVANHRLFEHHHPQGWHGYPESLPTLVWVVLTALLDYHAQEERRARERRSL